MTYTNKRESTVKKESNEGPIVINPIQMSWITLNLIGVTPLVPHAVSAKAKGSLLFPAPKKNAAEKAATMKHEPLEEMRDAAYKFVDADNAPTRMYMPGEAFHSAMASAAIDLAGAKKAQVGRLTSIPDRKIAIYGIPKLWMTVVRSSDMARTPDIRSLPILPEWCCTCSVRFVDSLIKGASIANLLSAAGEIVGVGDGRVQRGKLSMGGFRLGSDDDADFVRIRNSQKDWVAAQDAALLTPDYYDLETEQLYLWFEAEKLRRQAAPVQGSQRRGKKSDAATAIAPAATNGGDVIEAQQ
jgi:hypothetical protein